MDQGQVVGTPFPLAVAPIVEPEVADKQQQAAPLQVQNPFSCLAEADEDIATTTKKAVLAF